MLPATAVYVGWAWLLHEGNFGLFNHIIRNVTIILNKLPFVNLEVRSILFLAHQNWTVPSLALIAVWLCGNMVVIFLAGLQGVPRVYHEAAEIDGANFWQRFWNVTIPCMSPIIFYNLLMSVITHLQIVTPTLVLRNPPGSRFITFIMYEQAFTRGNLGYASAISFLLFILIGIFTTILFATSKTWIFSEGERK
jgi:multiple sugar transport system permease protein